MADGAVAPRLHLTRRDLAARGAPWVVVDVVHPDDVGDLWAQVTGTGHPVLWRVSGGERPEFAVTGPWADRELWSDPDPAQIVSWGTWARVSPWAWMLACVAVTRQLIAAVPVEARESCIAALENVEAYVADDSTGGSLSVMSGNAERAIRAAYGWEVGASFTPYVAAAVVAGVRVWENRDPRAVLSAWVLPAALRWWGSRKATRAVILRALGVRA